MFIEADSVKITYTINIICAFRKLRRYNTPYIFQLLKIIIVAPVQSKGALTFFRHCEGAAVISWPTWQGPHFRTRPGFPIRSTSRNVTRKIYLLHSSSIINTNWYRSMCHAYPKSVYIYWNLFVFIITRTALDFWSDIKAEASLEIIRIKKIHGEILHIKIRDILRFVFTKF